MKRKLNHVLDKEINLWSSDMDACAHIFSLHCFETGSDVTRCSVNKSVIGSVSSSKKMFSKYYFE